MEEQLTFGSQNHDLDNNDNFAPDDSWLAFDTRVDAGAIISNAVIGKVAKFIANPLRNLGDRASARQTSILWMGAFRLLEGCLARL